MKLTAAQKQRQHDAAHTYHQQLTPQAAAYLRSRGITNDMQAQYKLGYVHTPIPGHEQYLDRISIPYHTPAGIVDIRFRCFSDHNCKDHGCPKYLSQPNHKPRLYNTPALVTAGSMVAICEGEFDALILTHHVGIPAVGLPGAQAWQEHYPRIFGDYQDVLIFADSDKAGRDLAKEITSELSNAWIVGLPDNHDVTDVFLASGADALLDAAGLLN